MFEKGDYIVCGNNGVCIVEEITEMRMKGVDGSKLYYKLSPVENSTSKVFTPVDNNKVVMRKMITKQDAEELIKGVSALEPMPVPDDKQREELYKKVMHSCDPGELFRIIKTLYNRRKLRFAQGKKNMSVDERYFKQFENNLYSELALALEKNKDEIVDYIKEKIGAEEN